MARKLSPAPATYTPRFAAGERVRVLVPGGNFSGRVLAWSPAHGPVPYTIPSAGLAAVGWHPVKTRAGLRFVHCTSMVLARA